MGVSLWSRGVKLATILAAPLLRLFEPLRHGVRAALRRRGHAAAANRRRQPRPVFTDEAGLRILFERLPDAVLLLDPARPIGDWRIVDCNPAACRMNGYSRDELLGMSIARLNAEPAGDEAEVARHLDRLKHGEIMRAETLRRHKDGTIFPIEVSTSLVTIHGRELILGVDRDISERKRTEAQLRFLAEELAHQAALAADNARLYREARQSAAAQAEFLSIAAHELRTPVTALLGYIQLLRDRLDREADANPRDRRMLRIMFEQGERLGRLINSLLDLGRIETGHFTIRAQPVDLHALVGTVIRDLEPSLEEHTVIFDGVPRPAPLLVHGDPERLEQVFHNLLQNAVKYSPAGGPITVRLTHDERSAAVTVIDRGIGIPEAALPNLFQRFFRAENTERGFIKGMGIGLFLVHEIVTRHGGTVTVTSRVGEGSTFVVTLPLLAEGRESAS